MNLDEFIPSTRGKVLVYGAPKTGKTALVGKLASKFTLHWLDLESGIKTLLNPAMLDPQFRKNINVIPVPDHKLYPVAIDTVREVCAAARNESAWSMARSTAHCASSSQVQSGVSWIF